MIKLGKKKKAAAEGEENKEEKASASTEGEGAEAPAKKSKKKLFIIIGAVVLLLGGGAGAYFGGLLGGEKPHAAEGESAEGDGHGEETAEGGGHGEEMAATFYDLPEFLVNLNTNNRQSSFLKVTVVVELDSPEDQAAIDANLPRIIDSFNTYLRELRQADLYGSAGIYRLREELLSRLNKAIAPAQVKDVLFKQVLVQ